MVKVWLAPAQALKRSENSSRSNVVCFKAAHLTGYSQRLANIPSTSRRHLLGSIESSKLRDGTIQTQLGAVPLDSKSAIQSLKLLSISKGKLDPFPAIAGRPLCIRGM